jgi:hypothetical protein
MTFFCFNALFAQQKPEFRDIDKNTYDLYLRGSWRELIRTGEHAVSHGIDYYYLRMRLGIAAYEIKDYAKTIRHCKKALEFNSADDTAKEYLWLALLLYGREIEADRIAQDFSPSLKKKLSYNRKPGVRSLDLNYTGSALRNQEDVENLLRNTDQNVDGYQSVTRNFRLFGAGLEHDAGKSMRLYHSAGYLSKSYILYSRETTSETSNAKLSQLQYYLSGRIFLGSGSFLIPSVHYVNVRIPYQTRIAGPGGRTFIMQQNMFYQDFATSLRFEKYAGKTLPGISAGYSNINDERQIQGSLSLSWFPGGNLNLYSQSEITRYFILPEYERGEWIISQNIGFRLFPRLWLEIWGSRGDKENFAGSGASLIYNDIGLISEQYGLNLVIPISSIKISANYIYAFHESRYMPDSYITGEKLNPIEFNTHKLTGGIKWIF